MTDFDRARMRTLSVGLGLSPTGDRSTPLEPTSEAAALLIHWALAENLSGLLSAALDGGEIVLDDAARASCNEMHVQALRTTLCCEAAAAEVTTVLERHGIASWLLKGLATAHLDYPDPAWRNSNDADILVDRGDLGSAIEALTQHGYGRAEPGLAAWWERRFGRAVVLHSPDGVEVDLHAAFTVGYFGERFDPASATCLTPDSFDLGGSTVRALAAPARLLFSCCSAVIGRGGQPRLYRDIAQQLLVSRCDWQTTVELAAAADGESVVATAFARTADAIGLDPTEPAIEWAAGVRPSERAARALALAERGATEGWSADVRSTLLALGPFDRARFLAGLALAPRANRQHRGRTLRDQLGRVGGLLRPAPDRGSAP